jgi:hypothetical protein
LEPSDVDMPPDPPVLDTRPRIKPVVDTVPPVFLVLLEPLPGAFVPPLPPVQLIRVAMDVVPPADPSVSRAPPAPPTPITPEITCPGTTSKIP